MIDELISQLRPRSRERITTRSLWDNYAVLLAVLGLLSAEWLIRKRYGLA
jgi:hypothetical protein